MLFSLQVFPHTFCRSSHRRLLLSHFYLSYSSVIYFFFSYVNMLLSNTYTVTFNFVLGNYLKYFCTKNWGTKTFWYSIFQKSM